MYTNVIALNVVTRITNCNRINLAVQHTSSPDWTKCDSAKVENIRRKIKAVMHIDDTADPALNRVIGLYVDYYISGMENMSNLRIGFPEIYEDLYRLEQSFKNEIIDNLKPDTYQKINITGKAFQLLP